MNLGYLLARASQYFSDRIALIEEGKRFTFRQFNQRVNRLANGLLGLGLAKGDRVGLLLENCHQYLEARSALEKCGIVYIPLNILLSAEEQSYILADAGARAVICSARFLERVERMRRQLPRLETVVAVGAAVEGQAGYREFERLVEEGSPSEPPVEVSSTDLCSLNYTSGSTGRPKGVMLSQGNWMAVYRNMLVDRDIQRDDLLGHIGPLTHASGSYFFPYLLRGAASLIIPGGADIDRLLFTIARERITAFTCVPTVLQRILNHPELHRYDLSSLRNIGYGAAPMPVEQIRQAIKVFGPILTQNYGLTEAYMTVCNLRKEDHVLEGELSRRLASVGRPYTFVEVRVVDEQGNDLPPGEKGEIIVRSDHVMQGYWNLPQETAAVLREGWLYTGDVALTDEDGYIYIVDRKKDMIISGGFNIYPREVEEVLYSHPAVREAAVIGVPDPDWGEIVRAVVVVDAGAGLREEDLMVYCREKLGFKRPKEIRFIAEMPHTSTGKIDKKALRQEFSQTG